MIKEFNANEHISCPLCNFEATYMDRKNEEIGYMFLDGTIDHETMEYYSSEASDMEENGLYCNSIHCGEKIEIEEMVNNDQT